ncbi:MAG: hypothetical protein KatS3mg022_2547 [Armatimonadota bacterium]|nr:MAG: hypothetical protein KatS3mg022_2547 [Armatimonadota bacterium]
MSRPLNLHLFMQPLSDRQNLKYFLRFADNRFRETSSPPFEERSMQKLQCL